ncbi:PREDICTED: cell division cycle-associated protein 7-like isoform X2 [Populus euphratica]|uniref:Cell division cycle-associated protein 7-like isoform X2 n=1 Tax=Populus euphratica TaxID=75702 RepID=A0AAJ6T3Y1_POPEU|nr:PREDICTED: cell division cycle-associated protein 7-like isoform X2 [Populus euphratica]
MGKLKCKSDYEDQRNARILENQARLESLGIHKTLSDLRSLTSSSPKCERKKWTKRVYETAILRRSDRLKRISSVESSIQYSNNLSLRRSNRLKEISTEPVKAVVRRKVEVGDESEEEEDEKRPANAPLVKVKGAMQIQLSPEASARRCSSKGRGTIYNSVFGICCHFCRQKTLCSEEDCKRCSNLDPDEPCIGKTDCSFCHSPTGVFCRGCLKVRYGEDIEEVRENKKWMCPHCVEERGSNPYWICNRYELPSNLLRFINWKPVVSNF